MKIPVSLFLVALAARVGAAVRWRFDGLYGQDAFAYLTQSVAIAERLPRGQLPPDFFWPNGYPLLNAVAMWLLDETPLAAQLVAMVTGAALSPLAYLLYRELFPKASSWAGVAAGLSVALAGQPVLSSISVMADMPAVFWAALAGWLWIRAWRAPKPAGWMMAAGAALAMSITTRWLHVLLVPAFLEYAWIESRERKRPVWLLVLPLLAGALIVLPQIALSLNRPEGILHSWLLGWNPVNAVHSRFDNLDGHYEYALPVGLFYAQPAGHPAYLFPTLGLAALWGIWRAWRAQAWSALALLLGWSGPMYAFLAGIPYENFRFGLSLWLPFVVFAALGSSDLQRRLRAKWLVPSIVVASLLATSIYAYAMLDEFLTIQNADKATAFQAERAATRHVPVLTFGLTQTLQHYTRLDVIELYHQDDASLEALTRERPVVYVLLDVDNIARQWRGREPDANLRWLRAHTTMRVVAEFPRYTLFEAVRHPPSPIPHP